MHAVAVSADGARIASADAGGVAILWDATSGEPLARLEHPDPVFAVAFGPAGGLVSGCADGRVRRWSSGGDLLDVLEGHSGWVHAVAVSPDGERIVSGSQDLSLRIWSADTGDPVATLGHGHPVVSVAFGPDGARIVAGMRRSSRAVRVWESEREAALEIWNGTSGH